jgi:hypothetical protein
MRDRYKWALFFTGIALLLSVVIAEQYNLWFLAFLHEGGDPSDFGWGVIFIGLLMFAPAGAMLHREGKI